MFTGLLMTAFSERTHGAALKLVPIILLAFFLGAGSTKSIAQEKSDIKHDGANINRSPEEQFQDPLLRAIAYGPAWLVAAMLDKGRSPNVQQRSDAKLTPILLAILCENEDSLKILLDHKADVEARDQHGINALMYACYRQNFQLINMLIRAGAHVNSQADGGTTPLMISAYLGNPSMLKLFLEDGADVRSTTDVGATALMVAADSDEAIRILVDSGADVNLADDDGWTALFHAVQKKQLSKIKALLKLGAKTDVKDKSGVTPRDLAAKEQDRGLRTSMLKLLEVN